LQSRREVRRLADDAAFLRLTGTDEIADDNTPGRNPDPQLEPFGPAIWPISRTRASPARTARSASSSWALG
jgi:hypothetical protein